MKKTISIILILITFFSVVVIPTKTNASETIKKAELYSTGYHEVEVRWGGMGLGFYYVVYKHNGVEYPAYCVQRELDGPNDDRNCIMNISSVITNVSVWRAIINGYPYKTFSELGCKNKEEAYFATKQAVYCMLYDRNPSEYTSTGTSGKRIVNAIKQIVQSAKKSNEVKVSSNLIVSQEKENWAIDNINNKYVSKTFNVSAKATMKEYTVTLENSLVEGTKIVDEENKEKNKFNPGEKFKIIMPITNLNEDGKFTVKVEGNVATKPIWYGISEVKDLQDHALTGEIYESGSGEKTVAYTKNETKIVVLKQEEENQKPLEGVKFELLNENKEVLFADLTTDKEGKVCVENLLPGKYYLRETETVNEYSIYSELIEVNLTLNETVTVTVNNSKEEIEVETPKPEKEIEVVVKLPKTGC